MNQDYPSALLAWGIIVESGLIMPLLSLKNTALILVSGVSLGACATYGSGYGGGYGYGNSGYGNSGYGSGISVTYTGGNYYGWNGDYYYPGSGYYVYDNYRRPYRWNNVQQRYWSDRQSQWRQHYRRAPRKNWSDFGRRR